MGKLLKFEFRKLVRQKSFYICNAVLLVLILLSAFMNKVLFEAIEDLNQPLPTATGMVKTALSGGNLTLITGIFIALFASEDHTDGTLKNIYAKGYSRTQVYASKLIAAAFFSVVACAVSLAGSFAAGALFFEIGPAPDLRSVAILEVQIFAVSVGYTALFFAISMILKKTGSSIAGCIVAPMLVSLLFSLADSLLRSDKLHLSDYWLDNAFSAVTQTTVSQGAIVTALVVSLIYAILCTAGGICVVKRQEL